MRVAQVVNAEAFARDMATLGPFEPNPEIAVAVSGGADSMSLALLARQWVEQRSGILHALTVDHGLRPESTAEARQVGAWMAQYGITHGTLTWAKPTPGPGLQAAARAARYDLLESWCAERGVLHLLVGHHADDQAETVVMRLAAGSGGRGLAGMALIAERPAVRVLRPLLRYPRAAIRSYLARSGQAWVEDPSNEDLTFARGRLRRQGGALSDLGLTSERLADTAAKLGRARSALEAATARVCAETMSLFPSGYAIVDSARLTQAPAEIGRRALAAIIATVSGRVYGPRSERLDRLYRSIGGNEVGRARTLAGCRVGRWRGRLLVSREMAAIGAPVRAPPAGGRLTWDRRFCAIFPAQQGSSLFLGALGREGMAQVRAAALPRLEAVPGVVRPTVPTIWRGNTVLAVPHLDYGRFGDNAAVGPFMLKFVPPHPVCPPEFGIV